MASNKMHGRDFIKMICPLIGVETGGITGITITANIDDAARVEVRKIVLQTESEISVIEATASVNVETRQFIVEVREVISDIAANRS